MLSSNTFKYLGTQSIKPNALTGKEPNLFILTGTAKNLKPSSGSATRLQRCSTIRISAPNKMECTGLVRFSVSSMFRESIPTRRQIYGSSLRSQNKYGVNHRWQQMRQGWHKVARRTGWRQPPISVKCKDPSDDFVFLRSVPFVPSLD